MARAGAVYVDVLPSLEAFGPAVRRGTAIPLAAAGRTAGREYSQGLIGSVRSGLGGMSATVGREARLAADQAIVAVNEASGKVAAAKKREADAIGVVRLAEEKLNAARRAGGGVATERQSIALTGAEERLARALRTETAATEGAARAARGLVRAEEMSTVATREAGAAAETSGRRFGRMATGVGAGADQMTSKLGGFAKGAAGMAGIFAGFEAAKFAGESFKAASEFQRSTNVLVTAADESTKNLKIIRAGIIDISNETGTGVDHLSEGMYTIEKAGIRGASGLQVLRVAAKGAREENANLATVTGAMTSIMASYHVPVSKSANVMNALATAAGASKTTMEQFAGSLSTVLPLASANKISFADVAGAIGTLTSHGTSADQATQELAFSIRGLSAPNAVAVKEMGQLGISAQDVSANLGKRGLTGTMKYLSEAVLKQMGPSGKVLLNTFYQSRSAGSAMTAMLSKMSPAARKTAQDFAAGKLTMKEYSAEIKYSTGVNAAQLSQFGVLYRNAHGFNTAIRAGLPGTQSYSEAMKKMTGGMNGLNVALQITGESTAGTKRRVEEIAKSMGNADQFTKRWNSTAATTAVQMDRAKMSIHNAGMQIATNLLPSVAKMARAFAGAVLGVTAFTKQNWGWIKKVAVGFLAVVFAIKAWNVVSRIAAATQLGFAVATGTSTAAIETQTVATRVGAIAARSMAAAQTLWNLAMDANPYVLIGAAIIALGVAIVIAYKKSATFQHIVQGAWRAVKAVVFDFVSWWKADAWPAILTGLTTIGNAAKWLYRNAILPAFSGMKTAVSAFSGWWTGTAWPAIGGTFRQVGTIATWLWKNAIQPAFTGIKVAAGIWWAAVKIVFMDWYYFITRWVAPVIVWLYKNVVAPIFRQIGSMIGFVWSHVIKPAFDALVWSLRNVVGPTVKWLYNSIVAPYFRLAGSVIGSVWSHLIKPAFDAIVWTLRNVVGPSISWFYNAIVKPMFAQIGSAISSTWSKVIKPTFDAIQAIIRQGIGPTFTWMGQHISAIWKNVEGYFTSGWSWVKTWVSRSWNGLTYLFTHPIQSAKDAISKLLGATGLQGVFSGAMAGIKKIWSGMGGVIKAPIKWALDHVVSPFDKAFNKISGIVGVNLNLPESFPGFHDGGYTGNGGKYEPKGIVHGGEYVIRKESTQRIERERPGFLAGLNGYAGGGKVVGGLDGQPASFSWPSMWNIVKSQFPSAVMTSNYRPGARIHAGGGVSYHAKGQAIDIGGPVGLREQVANWLLSNYGSQAGDLIHSPSWGHRNIYHGKWVNTPESTYQDHLNHVHWGEPPGGVGGGGGILGSIKGALSGALGYAKSVAFSGLSKLIDGPLGALGKRFPSPFAGQFLTGAVKKLLSGAMSFGNDGASGGGGGMDSSAYKGGGAFDGWWKSAIGVAGPDWAKYRNATYTVAKNESGLNPNAVNNWDSNAKAGHPSRGLMQFIPGTFNQYEWPGHSQFMNPVDQILAFFRYSTARYGSPYGVPGVRSVGAGGKYRGYELGTHSALPGIANVAENGYELVMSPQSRNFRGGETVLDHAQSRRLVEGSNGPVDLTPLAAARIAAALAGLSIKADGREIAHVVDPHLGQLQALAGQVG